MNFSVALLGTNARSCVAMLSASMPGGSTAAMRAGPRTISMNSPRSSAVAQPEPNITSARVLPWMCGTPNESRLIVSPLRGRSVLTVAPWTPNAAFLKCVVMSASVTLPNSGARSS